MDKTKIKNFAVWAREKLITDIKYKAGLLGITDIAIADELPQSTADLKFYDIGTKEYAEVSGNEIKQREALVKAIKSKEKDCGKYTEAFDFVVEEVAYTWFNRLVAIHFMEVNDYLPSGVRVLSSESDGKIEPDLVTSPFDTDLEFTPFEQDKIIQLKDENKLDDLFRMLFIKQCNKFNEILPELFEKTDDYTELLLTLSFTDKDGIVYRLTHDIDESDFDVAKEGQIEIIGWMYQFYNSAPKDQVFANLKKNKKIRKEDIPAATQLFTPDWIVRYMVENSLGRFWIEGHPNESLKDKWLYFLEETEQDKDVKNQLAEIQKKYMNKSPEDIKIIDPCMGSGHILVYAFDVLMQIYDTMGYTARDAVRNIIEKNIYGLDIDKRASQLSYFAMMMKARQYDRRFFSRNLQPNIYTICESNEISSFTVDYFCNGSDTLMNSINCIIREMKDAKEYGSILDITPVDFEAIYSRFNEIDNDISLSRELVLNDLLPIVKVAEVLARKYDIVITNPPYMGNSGMESKLAAFIKKAYPDSKNDLYAVFIEKCAKMTKKFGFQAMITQHSWMFLSSYEKMRKKMIHKDIISMAHLGPRAFEEIGGEVVQATTFVIRNSNVPKYKGIYKRLIEFASQDEKEKKFLEENNYYLSDKEKFSYFPGEQYVYWVGENIIKCFTDYDKLEKHFTFREGIHTADNDRFLRFWYEIGKDKIVLNASNEEDVDKIGRWVPYNKGGKFRKWYGNNEYVIGFDTKYRTMMASLKGHVRPSQDLYFKEGGTWTAVASGKLGLRYYPEGFLFDAGGQVVVGEHILSVISLLNTKVYNYFADMLMPTLNYKCGMLKNLPDLSAESKGYLENIGKENVEISKEDWDSFETSWDFACHPLAINKNNESDILSQYNSFKEKCESRFRKLKTNEEKLNQLLICKYELNEELSPYVEDKDITVNRIFDCKEDIPENMKSSRFVITKQDVVKGFISYAVGCMLGRYSLDEDGLIYAGGEWDETKYKTFIPDEDNCIPITDEDYFEDDIVGRFADFVSTVFGEDSLEENLTFIANALGNRGNTPREIIRNYFLNDFIKDHIKKYQKRPIYWMFDSGKQNGFKALVYMHRWNSDTVGNLRVEYLHKIQRVYEKEIERMQEVIDNSKNNKEISTANKRKEKLQKQLKETKDYDAKIAHIALSQIDIDLDDGVKVNYEKVQTAQDGKKMQILVKI